MPDPGEDVRATDEEELTEERMRRALGLGGTTTQRTLTIKGNALSGSSAGHTSARPLSKEGGREAAAGAQVGTLPPLQQRIMELEQQLAAEREQHGETRGLLQKAKLAAGTLEARLQQAALAQGEELETERGTVIKAQRALDEALFEIQQQDNAKRTAAANHREATQRAVVSRNASVAPEAKVKVTAPATLVLEPTATKPRGRPRTRPLPEPKPVRWWTPSYKAKMKR